MSGSASHKTTYDKPVVIGIYGVPGSGKTFLLSLLKQLLGQESFAFYEGSQIIAALVPGGLDAFKSLDETQKTLWRQQAIDKIRLECAESGKAGVVAGHIMFWHEGDESGVPVITQNDLDTFTHILYLDVDADLVVQRRLGDMERDRPIESAAHIHNWQQAEKTHLRSLSRDHGIIFSSLPTHLIHAEKVSTLLRDFQVHDEKYNLSIAETALDNALFAEQNRPKTVLFLDADRTLAPQDTGSLFWEKLFASRGLRTEDPLKVLFSSGLGYSYTAFRQAVLLYEEAVDDWEFDALCQDVASEVIMYPEFVALLQLVAEEAHIGVVVVTCGLRRVWEKVLEREGLSKKVQVIGGGRISDGFVVTPAAKGLLVSRLRETHQLYVWAFGDSPLDLEMLCNADQAIVVVGEERLRSRSMDAALKNAIENHGLQARQAVLPSTAPPRLDTMRLPLIHLTEPQFVDSILARNHSLHLVHATERNTAKLLMTPMRNAAIAGPALVEAHRRAGWYLATEFLGDLIGVEEYSIPHVQGHPTTGYRLLHEERTLIVPLMRGGEPMAFGVYDALPLANFVHAGIPTDIGGHHLQGMLTIVLVDSVINSGQSILKFVRHIRSLHATISIVVVTGVVQAQCISGSSFSQALACYPRISIVALRLSENKFTGRGTTDTGNRLFNTVHLP